MDIEQKELRQVDALLESYHTGNNIRQSLPIFWALLAIKCVMTEYFVQKHSIPVNPFWIWGPSLSMGVVATVLFGRFSWRGFMAEPPSVRRDAALWGISILCMMVVLIIGFQSNSEAVNRVPFFFALILAFSFYLHAVLEKSSMYSVLGVIWTAITFYFISSGVLYDLVSFSGFMFLFVAVPFTWKWWRIRQMDRGWSYEI